MDKRWLNLIEAAKYSSIGRNRLKTMAHTGAVKACQDQGDGRNGWIFDRISIDQYFESQMVMVIAEKRAQAIIRGIRM